MLRQKGQEMKPLARINTWVPAKTKKRIVAVAERTGLKTSDVVRIGLGIALDHFESGPVLIPSAQPGRERRGKMDTS